MKCIYREMQGEFHCDKAAEYIYLGKSYCSFHLAMREIDEKIIPPYEKEKISQLNKDER